jgi:hypothetical protein
VNGINAIVNLLIFLRKAAVRLKILKKARILQVKSKNFKVKIKKFLTKQISGLFVQSTPFLHFTFHFLLFTSPILTPED